MIVLGFDTATASTAVGLRLDAGATLQARDAPRPGAGGKQDAQGRLPGRDLAGQCDQIVSRVLGVD